MLTLIALCIPYGLIESRIVDRFEIFIYDTRFQLTRPEIDPRVAIIDIDEKSLNEIGRFPWSRNIVAKLVDRLVDDYKVASVGFDIWFSEPDTSSGYSTLENLVNKEMGDAPGLRQRLSAIKPALDYDGILAKSFQGRPVVLGYYMSEKQKKGVLPHPAFSNTDLSGRKLDAYDSKGYEANLANLQNAARAGGFVNTSYVDDDGVLRSTPLLLRVGDSYYESLGLATARVGLGASKVEPVLLQDPTLSEEFLRDYGALEAVKINTEPLPKKIMIERLLTMRVQYRGTGGPHGGAFRYISATDILHGRTPKSALVGAMVLVGTTAPGLYDLRSTPVNSAYPGVEVHANVIKSILDGEYKQKPDYDTGFDMVQVLLVGVVLAFALSALGPLSSILLSAVVATGLLGFNFWAYHAHNLVLPVATALLLTLVLFVVNVAWGYLFEYRKGRAMVNLFGEYVAPELVAVMAENPASYNMEGESRELTVLFCDVRNFTTISESLTPHDLREFINIYLTAMSEVIRGNRGTLDKYIGDAVMAFWGAPVALPDHASRAVASALQMVETANKLDQDFHARGWPPLKIGIGLNTGEMRVGDMGSKIRKAYTVMGDAVNLGSRLEGITKEYGVGLLVGESTKLAAKEFIYRELDCVRVKGKNEPVPIFEPVGMADKVPDEVKRLVDQWHEALGFVRKQEWDAAQQRIEELQRQEPDRKLYKLYLERIAYYRDHPPGADWDGVTTFQTK
jgi:adenylate cyclase